MNTLDYRVTDIPVPPKLTSGLDAVADGVVGRYRRRRRVLADLAAEAEQIDALSSKWSNLSDHNLQERLREFRQIFRRQQHDCEEQLPEALAAIREAADRQTGLRPYTVQLLGALALHDGCLAEMATGEGKTLTAGLAAVLAGWTKRPFHIVTANDYLAQRDAEWLRPLYQFCGCSVGFVTGQMPPLDRRRNYGQDITYTTSKEIVADFLRDRLRLGLVQNATRRLIPQLFQSRVEPTEGIVMRGLHTAIVDEADSLLIDEAVTPLIISSEEEEGTFETLYTIARELAQPLEPQADYRLNLRYREVELLPAGVQKISERCAGLPGFWKAPARRRELIEQALSAREFFHFGKQYAIDEGKVIIVDEFTGRLMHQRKWSHGLHQAIEAKENLKISPPSETLARLSFQRFFRLFRQLSGMTGTAREAASEFWHIYRLPVITIPTHRPCVRRDLPNRIFPDQESKWNVVVDEIVRLHSEGRPILIGTRSITASELLAAKLATKNLHFNLLNAVRHREEAAIVAEAGYEHKITIATNMAGRGTDIKLGPGVAAMGGLHVIATERHESHRIDRQLYGRSGRQGDPGSAQSFVSADDELLRRFVPSVMRRRLESAVRNTSTAAQPLAKYTFQYAQFIAQRQAYRQRKQVLKMDTWLEEALSFAGTAQG